MSSTAHTIALVARREFTTRARTKAFLISNAIIMVLILVGIIVASILAHHATSTTTIGLVGPAQALSAPLGATAQSLGQPLTTSNAADAAAARTAVASGGLDVALIPGPAGGVTAVVNKNLAPGVRSLLMLAVIAGLAVTGATIYERSVLRTGTRVTWKHALRAP